ncbi:hypothetical protein [Mesorhizobium sp. CN2-181]|uniref:hypothetical protein n=1 Tax=Mesorhizobium yinganensis TaxID=3157707 RepID=UPI0032B7E595
MADDPGSGTVKPADGVDGTIQPVNDSGDSANTTKGEKSSGTDSPNIEVLLDRLLKQREAAAANTKDIWYFLSSGFFFMLVGASALLAAFLTMGTTHASFTFVLVVVGVAILLYGTGTQGAGNFETTAGEMKYKIGVAGGAGILAFAVGIGIVEKSADIRDAFQIEKKYARLIFRDQGDGIGRLTDYVPEISVNGVPVPSLRYGESIVALIPFLASPGDQNIQISANFYYSGSEQARNKLLSQKVVWRESLPLGAGQITTDDAGFDFPRLRKEVTVKLVTDMIAADIDNRQREAAGADGPQESIPAPFTPIAE